MGKWHVKADNGFGDTDSSNPQSTTVFPPYDKEANMPEANFVNHDAFDHFITAQVLLFADGLMKLGTVRKSLRDKDGFSIEKSHHNLALNATIYEVDFTDSPS